MGCVCEEKTVKIDKTEVDDDDDEATENEEEETEEEDKNERDEEDENERDEKDKKAKDIKDKKEKQSRKKSKKERNVFLINPNLRLPSRRERSKLFNSKWQSVNGHLSVLASGMGDSLHMIGAICNADHIDSNYYSQKLFCSIPFLEDEILYHLFTEMVSFLMHIAKDRKRMKDDLIDKQKYKENFCGRTTKKEVIDKLIEMCKATMATCVGDRDYMRPVMETYFAQLLGCVSRDELYEKLKYVFYLIHSV